MSNILPFKKPSAKVRAKGRTLCNSGFHKWVIEKHRPFDSRQGKLLTVHRCKRCGQTKVTAD